MGREDTVDKPVYVDNVIERTVTIVNKTVPVEKIVEKPVEQVVEKVVEVEVDVPVEVQVDVVIERPIMVERIVEKPVYVEQVIEKPVERVVEIDEAVDTHLKLNWEENESKVTIVRMENTRLEGQI